MGYQEYEARDAELRAIVSPEIMHLALVLHRLALGSNGGDLVPGPLYLEMAVAVAVRADQRNELLQTIDLIAPTNDAPRIKAPA